MLELQTYLRSTYEGEIIECTICMEGSSNHNHPSHASAILTGREQIVTRGIACYTPNCQTRMHTHCFNNYRRRNHQCPACKEDWTAGNNLNKLRPVGEAAFKEGQDQGTRRVRRKSTEEQEDVDAEGEDMDEKDDEVEFEPEPSQSHPNGKAKGKGKGKKKATRDESMEVDDKDEDEEEDSPQPRRRRKASRR